MTVQIWLLRSLWPADTDDFIFLGRAFEKIAKRKFGPFWSTTNPNGRSVEFIEDGAASQSQDNASISPDYWDSDEWRNDEVEEEYERDLQREKLSESQYWGLAEELTNLLRQGSLKSGARKVEGGSIISVGREYWQTELWRWRFNTFQIDMAAPFNSSLEVPLASKSLIRLKQIHFGAQDPHWLFVDKKALDKILRKFPGSSKESKSLHEQYCLTWLVKDMRAHTPKTKSKPEFLSDFTAEVEKRGLEISGAGFERAWKKAVKIDDFFAGYAVHGRKPRAK